MHISTECDEDKNVHSLFLQHTNYGCYMASFHLQLGHIALKCFVEGHLLSSTDFNQIIIQSGSIYACQLCPQFVYN